MDFSRLDAFLLPLHQDLDGRSKFEDVQRVAAIARSLLPPEAVDEDFELLLRFHALGNWLERMGNASRTVLATGIGEEQLRTVARSVRRLETPLTAQERALAAAVLIDEAGVRGLAERFSRARREGLTISEVAESALRESAVPDWLEGEARERYAARRESCRAFCRMLLEESGQDLRTPARS